MSSEGSCARVPAPIKGYTTRGHGYEIRTQTRYFLTNAHAQRHPGTMKMRNPPRPLAGEGTGEGGTCWVSPSPQSSPPVGGEEVFEGYFLTNR